MTDQPDQDKKVAPVATTRAQRIEATIMSLPNYMIWIGVVAAIGLVYLGYVFVRFILIGLVTGAIALVMSLFQPSVTTCGDFLKVDQSTRAQVAAQLYLKQHDQANTMAETNALFNTEYTCQNSPDKKLSDIPQ
jgi:hypothetical protein